MNCEQCAYYRYDEDADECICLADIDEDDYVRLMLHGDGGCPFYRPDDEYKIVRRQN